MVLNVISIFLKISKRKEKLSQSLLLLYPNTQIVVLIHLDVMMKTHKI